MRPVERQGITYMDIQWKDMDYIHGHPVERQGITYMDTQWKDMDYIHGHPVERQGITYIDIQWKDMGLHAFQKTNLKRPCSKTTCSEEPEAHQTWPVVRTTGWEIQMPKDMLKAVQPWRSKTDHA